MAAPVVTIENVTVARAGRPVLAGIHLTLNEGDRVFIGGENGAGKSSLLMLLAAKLHPYNNAGMRSYAWDHLAGEDFRSARKHIALISRDEQHRLQQIHRESTVAEFLTGHLEGQDFLYRQSLPSDGERVRAVIQKFALDDLTGRKLRTLSLGEMRRSLIARADLFQRRLYLLDEVFSSLSAEPAARVSDWIRNLPATAAVVLTGHDADRMGDFLYTDRYMVSEGKILKESLLESTKSAPVPKIPSGGPLVNKEMLVECQNADFYHDFTRIFQNLSFEVKTGDGILVTGPNGSGKTTLLRIMHGDFYPAWQAGSLAFTGPLAHEQKAELWAQVQFIAAAHFAYYPERMNVSEVLCSRYSGSIYDYPESLPDDAVAVIADFALEDFLNRPFARLSEGEKTRVLLARAFLKPAPVYLIDEGFIALSERYFAAAVNRLNLLPPEAAVVVAANERVAELQALLAVKLADWRLDSHSSLAIFE